MGGLERGEATLRVFALTAAGPPPGAPRGGPPRGPPKGTIVLLYPLLLLLRGGGTQGLQGMRN